MSIMRNKKGDLAVTVLVFMAVALAGAASIIFLTSERGIEENIVDARFLDEIYMTAGELDFYINDLIEISAEKSKYSENFKEDFIKNFKEQAAIYEGAEKDLSDYFSEMQNQIEGAQVEETAEEYKITVSFNFIITMIRDPFTAVYKYKKTFQKNIPKSEQVAETNSVIADLA
jgi:hypothetical protein